MRTWVVMAELVVLLAASAGAVGLATSCGSSCEDSGTCTDYSGPLPQCDGWFHYPDGGVCQSCARRDDAGVWHYPDGTPRGEATDPGPCSATGGVGGSGGASSGIGAAGQGGVGGNPLPCDSSQSPAEQPCLISDAYGIFVAPTGSDDAPGGKLTPVKTIAHGLALAAQDKKLVYVCNATYDEVVSIATGARLYGGFTCPDSTTGVAWQYQSGTVAKVAPSAPGSALQIRSVVAQEQVLIQDMHFVARDAVNPGDSSIAALVVNSPNVNLVRVKLEAGDAMAGADAVYPDRPEFSTFPNATALQGGDATALLPGGAISWVCPAGDTTAGGSGGNVNQDGGNGSPTERGGGQGGDTDLDCGAGGMGLSGAPGPARPDAAGAKTNGVVELMGWVPSNGQDGLDGLAGQGGGGGAGKSNGFGGGGGAGSCGGQGGPGGKGGGSSIALLAVSSPVILDDCTLITGAAGKGGAGLAGQPGATEVGAGGNGYGTSTGKGCAGGNGGLGGKGGDGGGGAGGVSVGIVYVGGPAMKPQKDDSTFSLGTFGAGGLGGHPGANDGIPGVAQPELEAQTTNILGGD